MSKPKQETTGEVVARLRAAKGWTAARLARAAAVPQATIFRLENGHVGTLRLDTAQRIAGALGVSLSVFDPPG